MGQAINRLDTLRLLIADGRIVDHRIERAKRIDPRSDASGLSDAAEVSHDHRLRLRDGPLGLLGANLAASWQAYPMPLLEEQLGSHSSEAVRRSGDKYPSHS